MPARGWVRTAVNLQDPSSRRLGAQQQIRRPEPMHASRPMSPDTRPKRGMMKLKREKQDLPGHTGAQNGSRMRTRGGSMGRASPEAHHRLCSSVGWQANLHERTGGYSVWLCCGAHNEARDGDALGLVGLLGQVGAVGAHRARRPACVGRGLGLGLGCGVGVRVRVGVGVGVGVRIRVRVRIRGRVRLREWLRVWVRVWG